ncbi:MAG TPA: glutathione S-transferase family protein [Sphingobium sp.]|nr:glutathione S-transferase family protein [Sphingobium sp.]
MLTIHHLGVSQSERIIWLCEELGLPYTLRRYQRSAETRGAPAEYQALHPMGLAPVIEVDGISLAETGAIMEYLVHRKGGGRLVPQVEDAAYPDWLFWYHFANGTLMPSEMLVMVVQALGLAEPVRKAVGYRSDRGFALADARLAQVPWFTGDSFTTADIMMAFPLTTMRDFSHSSLDAYPHIRAWVDRIAQRPAYRRAMAAGDPDRAPIT